MSVDFKNIKNVCLIRVMQVQQYWGHYFERLLITNHISVDKTNFADNNIVDRWSAFSGKREKQQ